MATLFDKHNDRRIVACIALLLLGVMLTPLHAQTGVALSGVVFDAQSLVLPGVTVELRTDDRTFVTAAVTDRQGAFALSRVTPGDYVVTATLLGFRSIGRPVSLREDIGGFEIMLEIGGFEQEISVTAMMPEVANESIVPARDIERRVHRDLAASLRTESGVNAVRRGSVNLEPTIRGLYEAQVGMFVDGTRTFAAGPARMDSGISHVSPHMLESVRVVKGPYALTWGSGTLSALRVDTFRPEFTSGDFLIGGRAGYNYGENGNGNDGYVGLWGSNDRARFTFFHNSRLGDDYTDGDDNVVPGHYESFETRWDLGFRPTPETLIEYTGGYQKQNDLDFPGRLLDATLFETKSHAVDAAYAPRTGLISEVFGQFYLNLKEHEMNNENKPTALDMPGRVPPFGLIVKIPTSSDTVGGRAHVGMNQGPLSYKFGFDVYQLDQSAIRNISRRSDETLLLSDIVWPDARITSAGGYGQVVYEQGRTRVGGTVRVDHEDATAGMVSEFFLENTTGDLDQSNMNVSAAANATVRISDRMLLNLGLGRAVRTPTVLERYSDRFPSTKFQIAAEFMGAPDLIPEKSLEFNVGSTLRIGKATVEGDVFYRTIDDYITVLPDPSLSTRLPLSPPVVYRYINGKEARFTGYDVKAQSGIGPFVDVRGGWTYVWAEDTFFDEPVFGISPFEQRYAVEVHTLDRARWVELSVTNAAAQERVAEARFELATEGWTTLDIRGGARLAEGFTLRIGIENLTSEFYATHINSINPFTRERIAEFGRSFFVGADFGF